jgi:hypothetical protein
MVVERIDGCFYEANYVDFNDFEYIVSAANVAGYLEAKDEINVESDIRLTEFILSEYEHWFTEEWMNYSFDEYITNKLIEEFGFKED